MIAKEVFLKTLLVTTERMLKETLQSLEKSALEDEEEDVDMKENKESEVSDKSVTAKLSNMKLAEVLELREFSSMKYMEKGHSQRQLVRS